MKLKHWLAIAFYLLAFVSFLVAIKHPKRLNNWNLMAAGLALWALGRIIELTW